MLHSLRLSEFQLPVSLNNRVLTLYKIYMRSVSRSTPSSRLLKIAADAVAGAILFPLLINLCAFY